MSQIKTNWITDVETLPNCFIACFVDYLTDTRLSYTIWQAGTDQVNEFDNLIRMLKRNFQLKERHITYNGLAFDSQIYQWLLNNEHDFTLLPAYELTARISKYAQYCIQQSNLKLFQDFAPWSLLIPQLDLYKMGHWDSDAKRASLKWLQCNIDWENLEDMPYHHTHYVADRNEMGQIKAYCFNDCNATKAVLHKCREAVDLRRDLTKEYGIELYSASEPRMAKEMFLHDISVKTGISKKELRQWATKRDIIKINDILLPYIKFERQEFVMLLNNFRKLQVQGDNLKGSFKYNVKYKGMSIDYGVGGIHGMTSKGVYRTTETHMIKSVDVKSYYPNLCIKNGWAPAHLPKKEFCEQYLDYYVSRTKYDKKSAKNKALKLLLNSTFGLTIDRTSFLSDPQMGVQITINGQLLLTMLCEMICENVKGAVPLVMNTDGMEIFIHRDQEAQVEAICKEWEKMTQLELEYVEYDTILAFDVNNYIAKDKKGELKGKGRYEYEPHDQYKIDVLHKNKTFLVIAKGIAAYFFDGIKPEDFVRNHANIYDFCGYSRARGQWKFMKVWSDNNGVYEEAIQKTLRYYVSKTGCKVLKRKIETIENLSDLSNRDDSEVDSYEKEKNIQVLAGRTHITVFNKYEKREMVDYGIDYNYYAKEIWKDVKALLGTQQKANFDEATLFT
jgi:hypothetical protein